VAAGRQLGWVPEDEQGDDGDDEPPVNSNKDKGGKDKNGNGKSAKPAKVAKPKPAPIPNPVTQVHFASFIVQ
jgi:hypothetical protein